MSRYTPPTHTKIVLCETDEVCSACGERIQEVRGLPLQKSARPRTGGPAAEGFVTIERCCSSCAKPCLREPTRKTRAFNLDRFPHLRSSRFVGHDF